MLVNGGSANRGGTAYGIFKIGVNVTAGVTNFLPYTIWMPKLDMAHAVNIPSPTRRDTVITSPVIPGLELHLPAGTVIRDVEGRTVTQLSITPIPTDRPPFPLPNGIHVPVFASIQPGGAVLIPPRAKLIYPNYNNEPAGTRISFWNYDAEAKGWYIYGRGTVTPNGKQIVPDPGVVIYEFSGIMISAGGDPPPDGPEPGGNDEGGDPVDLSTGLFVLKKTDLVIPDTMPIVLRRFYRPGDPISRAFGIGSNHPYELSLWSENNYQELDLILPDGGRVHYERISPGTGYADAVYEHTGSPSIFYKSQIHWSASQWFLRLRNGTVFVFPEFSPLHYIQDRYGNQITITRTAGTMGDITQISTSNGRWIKFTYGSGGRISQAKDNSGRTVGYTYDASNRLWKVTDPNGEITEYTYDASHRLLTIEDAKGIVYLTNEYDANGRVITQTQADTSTYEFAYTLNGSGKVTQTDVTDPRGFVRRVTFNSDGYTLTDTRAQGTALAQQVAYERQSGTNHILRITDPLDRETAYTYDSFGNVASVTRLDGTADEVTTAYTYEPNFSRVLTVTDPLSHTTTYAYDAVGNLTSVTDPLSHQSTFTYNSAGQLLTATNALSQTVTFGYEAGDLVSITDGLSRTTTRATDAVGRLIRVTNPLGHSQRFAYDNLNYVTSTTDSLQGVTSFSRDKNGNLLSVTDARSNVTEFEIDDMDRVVTRTDPLTHDDLFDYDENGNLVEVTDREGQVTAYEYDALNRVTEVTFDDSSTTSYTYDLFNRLTQVVDSVAGTTTFEYDDLDRLTEETTPQGIVSYTYDDAGRRESMTVDGQTTVNYTFDNANRLTQISRGTPTVTIAYDNADRRSSVTLPNGVSIEYTFDAASQLTALTYKYGGSTIGSLTYSYNAAGRRTAISGSYARSGLPSAVNSATYNAANQQTAFGSLTLTYDLNGNLTGDGTNTFSWNARNQLSSISGGTSASFSYDAVGRRTSKTLSSTTTTYLHDLLNPVQELSGSTPTANMLTGGLDEIFTRTDSSGTCSFLPDAIGSIIALTNSSGSVQTEYTYEPFGKSSTSGTASDNRSQFTARENDGTGLVYFRARYYSPSLQRFISEDPIGLLAGPNLYAYVNNAPLNYNDPLGLDPQEGGHGAPRQPGDPVPPPHVGPSGMIEEGIAKTPAEVMPHPTGGSQIAGRALGVAGGLGELAPSLYYYSEKRNERDRNIQDICCERKMGCCERPPEEPPEDPNGDPNNPNNPGGQPYPPHDPNDPYGPGSPGPGGAYPTGGRKN
jgi:RHS repeat-associated protein